MKIVGHPSGMSHQPNRPTRSSATRGAISRDAGLLRIRALTKGVAVTAAVGSVALGVVLAQPTQSQAASNPASATPGASTDNNNTAPAPPPDQGNQQDQSNQQAPLTAPAQPPADTAPQAPPAAVSGGS